jgi:hypothetical protein
MMISSLAKKNCILSCLAISIKQFVRWNVGRHNDDWVRWSKKKEMCIEEAANDDDDDKD